MNRRLKRIAIAGLSAASLVGLFGFAGQSSADTVVMGSTLSNNFDGGLSTSGMTVQLSYDPATSPNPVISPANGLVTGWKVKSADDGALYTLKVLRPNAPVSLVTATNSNFKAITSVAAPAAVPAGTAGASPTGAIFSYPASLPISKGDYLGVRTGGAATGLPQSFTNGVPRNLIANNFASQPADGSSADFLADEQHELLLQATVQFCNVPALKKLKTKAAKQALKAHDCLPKVKKSRTKKNKFKGKVLKQKTPAGTTAVPGTVVPIVIGQKK